MKELVQRLSGRAEFVIVLVGAFGLFIASNLPALFTPPAYTRETAPISNGHLQFLLAYELIVLLCLGAFLTARGWTRERIGLAPSIAESLQGLPLVVLCYLLTLVVRLPVLLAMRDSLGQLNMPLVAGSLDLWTIILVSMLNPVFEEVFLCGYFVTALKEKRGIAFAVNVSTAVRVACHLYQGPIGAVGVVPVGLLFAYWYAKRGRLWPIIFAHGVIDFVGLMAGKMIYG